MKIVIENYVKNYCVVSLHAVILNLSKISMKLGIYV